MLILVKRFSHDMLSIDTIRSGINKYFLFYFFVMLNEKHYNGLAQHTVLSLCLGHNSGPHTQNLLLTPMPGNHSNLEIGPGFFLPEKTTPVIETNRICNDNTPSYRSFNTLLADSLHGF
jgi:hypothetical protein